jgi:hypothetical protein
MTNRLYWTRGWRGAGLWLAVAGLGIAAAAQERGNTSFAPEPPSAQHERADSLAGKPSLPPAFTLPVEPLGFSAPGPIYLGQQYSLASLDFLDENHLLFTFRVPGLIHRERGAGDEETGEHHVRALVLEVSTGAAQAETVWTLHDRERYLWVLRDGHFLLRDGNTLQQGDATLSLKPMLHFPGPLLSVEVDPTQQFLVTNSREPVAAAAKPGDVASPATAAANVTVDGKKPSAQTDVVLRILHRDTGQVMLVAHLAGQIRLPINNEGYLESVHIAGARWLVNLNHFTGGSTLAGKLDSACSPGLEFIAPREVLASTCDAEGERSLVAMDGEGLHLWEETAPDTQVWPRMVMAPNGLRLARESLVVNHPVDASHPFAREDVKGQIVEVFDAANGQAVLTAPASPVLDAGGNVAISPTARRVAVLNAGTIQVFELPAPPPLPQAAAKPPGR